MRMDGLVKIWNDRNASNFPLQAMRCKTRVGGAVAMPPLVAPSRAAPAAAFSYLRCPSRTPPSAPPRPVTPLSSSPWPPTLAAGPHRAASGEAVATHRCAPSPLRLRTGPLSPPSPICRCRGRLRPNRSVRRLPYCDRVWPDHPGPPLAGPSVPTGAAQPHCTPAAPPCHQLRFQPAESTPPRPPLLRLYEQRRGKG